VPATIRSPCCRAWCRSLVKIFTLLQTGPPNGPVLFCWLASVCCRLSSSSSVMLPAGGPAGRRARGRSGDQHCTACQSHYDPRAKLCLNNTEPVEKLSASARSAIWLWVLQNVYIALPYAMAARTAGIDRNEEITSLSTYLCRNQSNVNESEALG